MQDVPDTCNFKRLGSFKGFLSVADGKVESRLNWWHRTRERREGEVSKYEMRIIMRAYLAASRMQRSPPFFWHAPCLYLSIGLCSSLLRLPFMAYEPHDPPRRFIIQRLPNRCSIQRSKFRLNSLPTFYR